MDASEERRPRIIKRNILQCLVCLTILESEHRHDYKVCGCPNRAMVDGGKAYIRYGGVDMTQIKLLTEYESEDKINGNAKRKVNKKTNRTAEENA